MIKDIITILTLGIQLYFILLISRNLESLAIWTNFMFESTFTIV